MAMVNGKLRGTRARVAMVWLAVCPLVVAGRAHAGAAAPVLTLSKDIVSSTNTHGQAGAIPPGFDDHWVDNDAADVLTFKLTIANTGSGPAHNVSVQDRFAQGATAGQGFRNCAIVSVEDMTGFDYTTTGNLFTSTLNLVKPIPNDNDGNLDDEEQVCITYTCEVDPDFSPGDPIDNCAQIQNYAAVDAGPNLATAEPEHCARTTVKGILSLDKSISDSSIADTTPHNNINQGEILDFTIVVTMCEGKYTNFTLTDTDFSIPTPITCGSNGFTCSGNVSVVGSTVTVAGTTDSVAGEIRYTYQQQQSGSGSNTAEADADNSDPPRNDDTTWTKADPIPNISIGGVPSQADPNDTINATLTWSNTGNPMYQCTVVMVLDDAIWDTASANVTLGANPSGWVFSYDEGTRTITGTATPDTAPCTDGSIAVGLKVKSGVTTNANYSLTATYSGKTLPAGHANQGAAGTFSDGDTKNVFVPPVTVQPFVDATKTVVDVNGGTLLAGETLTYTVVLTNLFDAVTNVVFTDTIPASTTYVGASVTTTKGTASFASGVITVDVGAMATLEQVTITFQVTVQTGTAAGTIISNQGSVDSTETTPEPTDADGVDSNGDQPTDIEVAGPTPTYDLRAQKVVEFTFDADASSSITAGDTMTYRIIITNDSTATVTNVTFADTIPTGLTYVGGTAAVVPASGNTIDVTGSAVSATVASMTAGSTATLSFNVTIDAPLVNNDGNANQETFTNQGTVDSAETPSSPTDQDGIPGNGNQPTTFTAVASGSGAPDIDVQKSVRLLTDVDGDGLYDPSDTAEYEIVLRNDGSAAATNVQITSGIPTNTTLVSGSIVTSQGTVSGTNPFTVAAGTVNPAGTVTVTFRVTIDAGTPAGTIISCQATATGDNFTSTPSDNDGNEGNGRNPTTFPVDNDADLSIDKTASVTSATVGVPFTYTLTVSNGGPDAADDVVVSDALPSQVTFGSATPSQGTCSEAAGTVTCNLGDLANGASATIQIVVTPTATGTLNNAATVTSSTSDPDPSDNTDSNQIPSEEGVDLQLTKSASPESPAVGAQITYTLIGVNNGPSPATGVVITDQLPSQVTHVSSTATKGACTFTAGTNTVACAIGTLAANEQVTVTIVATRNAATAFTNTAAIDGDQTDPTPGNNNGSSGFPPLGGENCSNCLDDDGDGLVDYEDGDCCELESDLTVTRSWLKRKRNGRGRLFVRGIFNDPSFDSMTPLTEDSTVIIRNDQEILACCTIEVSHWMRLTRRRFGFWDMGMGVCPPIKDIEYALRRTKRSVFEVRTGMITLEDYLRSSLGLTIRVGNRCASGSFTPAVRR